MSGPATSADAPPVVAGGGVDTTAHGAPPVEVTASRSTEVGGMPVRRALPRRRRRTVGPWCFVDHFGPAGATAAGGGGDGGAGAGMAIGPHPHVGLQTVTWLVEGEVVHRDSLGSEQPVRPGQLNLMTAGAGVAHAEVSAPGAHRLHGAQLWVALPEATRHGPPAFEHHASLPQVDLGAVTATVLLGRLDGAVSAGRTDWPTIGAELATRPGAATIPLDPAFEHAVVVLDGTLEVAGATVGPGSLAHLGDGRDELGLRADGPARALLLGGRPFAETVLMWWNFVARTRDEVADAFAAWRDGADRFGEVRSELPRIPAPLPTWLRH